MTDIEVLLKESIYNAPLTLLNYSDKNAIKYINSLLPYTTGFEIECNQQSSFEIKDFTNIPDIVNVDVDNHEQRYQIPAGVKGFICLYHISNALIKNSELNLGSGIHYHVDATDWLPKINQLKAIQQNQQWILKELDSWQYKGDFNSRAVTSGEHSWLRFSHHNTLEFRLGEMTFDYKLLVKRIIHCNEITKRLKRVSFMTEFQKLQYENQLLIEKLKQTKVTEHRTIEPDLDNLIKSRLR